MERVDDEQLILNQARYEIWRKKVMQSASEHESDDDKLKAWLGGEIPPIQEYRVPFHVDDSEIREEDYSPMNGANCSMSPRVCAQNIKRH